MAKTDLKLIVSPQTYLFSKGIQVQGEGWQGCPIKLSLKGYDNDIIIEQCLEGELHGNLILPKGGNFLVTLSFNQLKEGEYLLTAEGIKSNQKASGEFSIKRGGDIDKKSEKPNHRWFRRMMHHNRVRFGEGKNPKPGSRLEALVLRDKLRLKADDLGIPNPTGCNWHCIGPSVVRNGQVFGNIQGTWATNHISGRVTSIAIDPNDTNRIYIGTAQGGVWLSENQGIDWCPVSDFEASLAIGCVTVDPSVVASGHSQRIFVGTGEPNFSDSYYGSGILFSDDGGTTWVNRANVLFNRAAFSTIKVDPSNNQHLYAATDIGLFESIDEGVNWNLLEAGSFYDLIINFGLPGGDELIVGRFGVGIRRSQDGGTTFTTLSTGLPAASSRIALAQSPSNTQTIYAAFSNGATGGLTGMFVTTNGGNNWSAISSPANVAQSSYNLTLAVDPTDSNTIIFGEVELWRTTNGGTNWNRISPNVHPDQHALAFDPSNANNVFLGNDGGFFFSTDNGATWDHRNKGLATLQYFGFGQHPSLDAVILGGTQDNGAQRYLGHPAWEHSALGDGAFAAIDFADTTKFYESRWSSFPSFRSDSAGNPGTWQNKKTGITTNGNWFYPPLVMDPNNSNVLYVGYDELWRSSNNADNWTAITGSISGGSNITAITVAPSNSNIIYVGFQNGNVFRITFSAGSWSSTNVTSGDLPGGQVSDIAIHPSNTDIVYVTTSNLIFSEAIGEFTNDHVFRTDDAGVTWTAIVNGLSQNNPVNSICIDPANPTTLYIGADIGIFRSTNEGTNWSAWDDGLPNCSVQDIQFYAPKRLIRAATHGRSIWERPADSATCPLSDVYMRDNHLDTALTTPPPSAVPHPYEPTKTLYWWQSADIKIDAPDSSTNIYETPGLNINYIDFEELQHDNPRRDTYVRAFAQVHNRGVEDATNVKVRAFFADASAGLPPLPNDFWTSFPNGTPADLSVWRPVGPVQTIAEIKPGQPEIASWSWLVPTDVADHTCMICIIESGTDAITTSSLNVGNAVRFDNNVSLKNLHVDDFVMGAGGTPGFIGPYVLITDYNRKFSILKLKLNEGNLPLGTKINVVLPKFEIKGDESWLKYWKREQVKQLPIEIPRHGTCLQEPLKFEPVIFSIEINKETIKRDLLALDGILPLTERFGMAFWMEIPKKRIKSRSLHFDIEQWSHEELMGGSSYEIRVKKVAKIIRKNDLKQRRINIKTKQ